MLNQNLVEEIVNTSDLQDKDLLRLICKACVNIAENDDMSVEETTTMLAHMKVFIDLYIVKNRTKALFNQECTELLNTVHKKIDKL